MTAHWYRRLTLPLIAFTTILPTIGRGQEERTLRSTVARVTRLAFTESLPEADRIELFILAVDWESKNPPAKDDPEKQSKDRFLLRSFSGSLPETDNPYIDVVSHATIKGNACKAILDTWRKLKFRPNGAFCHAPVYGIRFYRNDELLYETTVCWRCHNFYIPEYDPQSGELKMIIYGFDDNPNARKLLKLFQQALPLKPGQRP